MKSEGKEQIKNCLETLTGKVSYPPFEGWHPAGTNPEDQHRPKFSGEGLNFEEPIASDNTVVLNGRKFRVEPIGEKGSNTEESELPCRLVPLD